MKKKRNVCWCFVGGGGDRALCGERELSHTCIMGLEAIVRISLVGPTTCLVPKDDLVVNLYKRIKTQYCKGQGWFPLYIRTMCIYKSHGLMQTRWKLCKAQSMRLLTPNGRAIFFSTLNTYFDASQVLIPYLSRPAYSLPAVRPPATFAFLQAQKASRFMAMQHASQHSQLQKANANHILEADDGRGRGEAAGGRAGDGGWNWGKK